MAPMINRLSKWLLIIFESINYQFIYIFINVTNFCFQNFGDKHPYLLFIKGLTLEQSANLLLQNLFDGCNVIKFD